MNTFDNQNKYLFQLLYYAICNENEKLLNYINVTLLRIAFLEMIFHLLKIIALIYKSTFLTTTITWFYSFFDYERKLFLKIVEAESNRPHSAYHVRPLNCHGENLNTEF